MDFSNGTYLVWLTWTSVLALMVPGVLEWIAETKAEHATRTFIPPPMRIKPASRTDLKDRPKAA